MAVAASDMWKTLSLKDLFPVFSGLFLMLTLTVPVQAYWRRLPFMPGQGIFLRLAGILIPLLLLALFGDLSAENFILKQHLYFCRPFSFMRRFMFLPLACSF